MRRTTGVYQVAPGWGSDDGYGLLKDIQSSCNVPFPKNADSVGNECTAFHLSRKARKILTSPWGKEARRIISLIVCYLLKPQLEYIVGESKHPLVMKCSFDYDQMEFPVETDYFLSGEILDVERFAEKVRRELETRDYSKYCKLMLVG